MNDFHVYDTTLRDGMQQEGLSPSVDDKLVIAGLLDELGVGFIEGGWPGAIPKDTEFFARARDELVLRHATLAAFGSSRRPDTAAADDPQVRALVEAGTDVVTLVCKFHEGHVLRALRTTAEENLAMIADTVAYLRSHGTRVFVDAEHFFDGYLLNPDYARRATAAASDAGAEVVVLCDTNGGMLPEQTARVVTAIAGETDVQLGVHCHNDTGCAVANTLAAVGAGVTHVQGTLNGYGERTGNADLLTVVANLELKLGRRVLPEGRLADAFRVAHAVAEVTNVPPHSRMPYVGAGAFTHKAGLHASAIKVDPDLYQHTDPANVGNDMRLLVSDMAGRASVELKGRELGYAELDREVIGAVTERVKEMEAQGYTFEAADASFELLLLQEAGQRPAFFEVDRWEVGTESRSKASAVSTARIHARVDGQELSGSSQGNGPVNALDQALREVLAAVYPQVAKIDLTDYRVRIMESGHGTDAVIRVLVRMSDSEGSWTTVGVSGNIVEASWEALADGVTYGLHRVRRSGR